MADLILNINISESKKKGKIVLETYEGTIPHLKKQQFSGLLRNANIYGINQVDNLSPYEFNSIKEFLFSPINVQINKYQHIISDSNLYKLIQFAQMGCLFYHDKTTPMFQVNNVYYKEHSGLDYLQIGKVKIAYDKTNLFLLIKETDVIDTARQIIAKAYVNINMKEHPLELVFDYDDISVNYEDKERQLDSNYRDYGFEESVVIIIKKHNWSYVRGTGFIYSGKNFNRDIANLVFEGISVFIDKKTQIVKSDFSNIHISYGIDWFDIKGDIELEDEKVNIADLVNFRLKRDTWLEFNGKMIIVPEALGSALKTGDRLGNTLRINKNKLVDAIEIAQECGNGIIKDLDRLVDYDAVSMVIDDKLIKILRGYQKNGVRWLLSLRKNGFGGCLADDMGLGKTLQIIAYLSDSSMKDTKSIIIVPKTLLANWEKEFLKFSPNTDFFIYHGIGRNESDIQKHKVIITTYGTILNDIGKLIKIEFENLIIDEAQNIKNSKTKIYRAIKKIKAKTRIILTGTPVENNIMEYLGLMQLINPNILSKVSFILKDTNNQHRIEKIKRITSPFLLRRMKEDVLKDLPKKQKQILYCKMDTCQKELYDNMLFSIRHEINRKNDRFEIKTNSIMLNGLLYLQEICCHPQLLDKELNPTGCRESAKFDLLLEILESLYVSGHKVVIFSRFTKMLKIIEKCIIRRHYNCFYLDGKTNNRMDLVNEFEASKNGVFLISLKAGGTGLNLVSADTAIIYDPWWNPAIEKQAEDRIYRIGQKKNVMIYKMIVEDSIEEKVQQLQKGKNDLYKDLLDGHKTPIDLTAELMYDLLMN
ncbi:MAG: DEAD/DEAH box helicase [Spirochaetia bacterium]|nr:DEAD/DEAH box helicase [Spirochaetia bacterium]